MSTDTERRKTSFTMTEVEPESDLGVRDAFKQSFKYGSTEVAPVESRPFALALPFSVRAVKSEDNLYDYVGEEEIAAALDDTLEEMTEYTSYFNTLDDIIKNKPKLMAKYFSKNPGLLFDLIDGNPELLSALAETTAERQGAHSSAPSSR